MTNIFRYNINTLDKTILDQEFESKSEALQNISWDTTRFDLEINLNAKAIESVDENAWSDPKLTILTFIESNVVDLRLLFDINGYIFHYTWTRKFFNEILYQISTFKTIKYLKIELPDSYHISRNYILRPLAVMPELKSLDLTKCCLQTDQNDTAKLVLSELIEFFNKINNNSKLTKIFLPSFLEKILIIENDFLRKLDTAILQSLQNNKVFIRIYPCSFFFNTIYTKYQDYYPANKPGLLKYLYHCYQINLETINKIKLIEPQNNETLSNLLEKKEKENEQILYAILKFIHSHEMTPDNLYWLEKFLREEINQTEHILKCLYQLQRSDIEKKYFYKSLQDVISSLMSYQAIKEQDPESEKLTTFIHVQPEEIGNLPRRNMILTLLKINHAFNLCQDKELAVIFYEHIFEYLKPIPGGYRMEGREFVESLSNECSTNNQGNYHLTIKLLDDLLDVKRNVQINSNIVNPEEMGRNSIHLEMLEEQNKITLLFDKFKDLYTQEQSYRSKILIEQLEEKENILLQNTKHVMLLK